MQLSMTGDIPLRLTNLRPDNTVPGSKMKAVDVVVGLCTTPCIVRYIAYGKLENLKEDLSGPVSLIVFRLRRTAYTAQGFVNVQITTDPVQLSVYIHKDYLQQFFGACALACMNGDQK
ncbi:MAG: hypothetical protein KBE09_05530 [Candidatus Pacebacteria bacterium]|nr:hypothetical protein [Candidatus Paceibacterota bacterium]